MRKDLYRTVVGIVIVGLVVVATYLYGNHQSQVAQQKQQTLQQTQPTPAKPAQPSAPSQPPAQAPVAASGPAPTAMPQTGGALDLIPLAAMIGAFYLYRHSRQLRAPA